MEKEKSKTKKNCQVSRWQQLKAQLNNLGPLEFLHQLKDNPDAIILDVRTEEEFNKGNSIAGAINVSYFLPDLWKHLTKLDRDLVYFVYCYTGRRSIRICTLMRNGGFNPDKIFNLDGGSGAIEHKIAHFNQNNIPNVIKVTI
jgi:rhodanese-related sulfurtransferase